MLALVLEAQPRPFLVVIGPVLHEHLAELVGGAAFPLAVPSRDELVYLTVGPRAGGRYISR